MEHVLFWGSGGGHLAAIRGADAWKKSGVAVSQMRNLPVAIYTGALFDGNVSAIIPSNDKDLLPIYAYCSDQDYKKEVKRIDKKKNVTNATLVKVPFDRDYWVTVAAERFPNGLPEPYSDDPTQWLFHGHPVQADAGTQLHVALARIAGYRWPAEDDMKMRLSGEARKWITRAAELPAGDNDGLLPIDACSGERPLAERLRAFLAVAYGADWSANLEQQLVEQSDKKLGGVKRASRATLEDWLPTRAFAQHAKLFHDRPFLWHIWDGRADGFSAFVHYNRLDRRTLEKLAYTLINDWITRADDGGKAETARALQARLARILEGEAPHDIFVRWKRLKLQPVGWDPDLDDGVRVNIRPFVTADVLRAPINVHWRKDRGTAVASSPWFSLHKGYRINDYHTTLAEKQAARGPA